MNYVYGKERVQKTRLPQTNRCYLFTPRVSKIFRFRNKTLYCRMLGEDETLLSVGSAYVARSLLRNKSVYKDICIKEKIGSFL